MSIRTFKSSADSNAFLLTESTVELVIPGIPREYTFIHISDLHIAVSEESDSEEEKTLAASRTEFWKNQAGLYPIEAIEAVASRIREISPDMVFCTGDTVDFPSLSNLRFLKRYLDALGTDCLLAPGNHDSVGEDAPEEMRRLYLDMTGGSPQFRVIELNGLDIVVINDSSISITEEQYTAMIRQIRKGRPLLLLLHVPVFSPAAKETVWNFWGYNWMIGEEQQNELNRRFLRLLNKNRNLVRAVFAGHIHFATGDTEDHGQSVLQYTAAPCFTGFYRIIHVRGC